MRKCDVVLPLVAIATPASYVKEPLRVFELDFEENLRVIRYCVKYNKRLIFPSTSEVYGMCEDGFFDEESSPLVTGPINKIRWIYSCSKQLLDRVIWAYGMEKNLNFTLFRPFNWIGPKLDSLDSARLGSSLRVLTQFALNLVEGTPIRLVDGGEQKRCFTDLSDGIEGLFRIIENKNQCAKGRIFNIGNPENEASVRELAQIMVDAFERHPRRAEFPATPKILEVSSKDYYGKGYQDVFQPPPRDQKRQDASWLGAEGRPGTGHRQLAELFPGRAPRARNKPESGNRAKPLTQAASPELASSGVFAWAQRPAASRSAISCLTSGGRTVEVVAVATDTDGQAGVPLRPLDGLAQVGGADAVHLHLQAAQAKVGLQSRLELEPPPPAWPPGRTRPAHPTPARHGNAPAPPPRPRP